MPVRAADKETLARFALACARRVLPLFEAVRPEDGRPRAALAALRGWLRGTVPFREVRRAALAAHAAARTLPVPAEARVVKPENVRRAGGAAARVVPSRSGWRPGRGAEAAAARAAARAVGQAAGTAHSARHAGAAALYARTAKAFAARDPAAAAAKELAWQRGQVPRRLRVLAFPASEGL